MRPLWLVMLWIGPARASDAPADRTAHPASAATVAVLAATAVDDDDPADSLYRQGRTALGRGDYRRAAELFHRIGERYPRSAYAADALYFEAFSLYRSGGSDDLRGALAALVSLRSRSPSAARRGDADELSTRICGELARRGDARCAADVVEKAAQATQAAQDVPRATADRADRGRRTTRSDCPDDDDVRTAALNALLQMDAERATPLLEKVLARRDPCSAELRRRAVFLLSQKRTTQTADILLRVAQGDPDRTVREQAVFWMSQVADPRATDMLVDLLQSPSSDDAIKDKALFALAQQRDPRARELLRDYAARDGAPAALRARAIHWLGLRRSAEDAAFLRTLYARLHDERLKETVLVSLAQRGASGSDRWLMDIVLDDRETTELRKKAVFWLGQGGGAATTEQLVDLYGRLPSRELREQLIFVYAQRHERAAVDKLFDIARSEKDRELRRRAIFWLARSTDPRVQQFLLELIEK